MGGGQRPHPAQKFWVYSDFLSFSSLYSRLLTDFLSHLDKWVRLIKFEAEYEHFYTREVEKPQNNTSSPSFHNVTSQTRMQLKINQFFKLPCLLQLFTLGRESRVCHKFAR